MKKLSIISLIALVAIVISSCGSSNNVVSNHGISKRKYNKGFFVQRNSNLNSAKTNTKENDVKNENTIAKRDKVKAEKPLTKREIRNSEANKNIAAVEVEQTTQGNAIPQEDPRLRSFELSNDKIDAPEWGVTENQAPGKGETIDRMPYENSNQSKDDSSNALRISDAAMTIILVILAIIIPPLAVFIYEDITTRFWIDLVLAILGFGVGFWLLGGLGWLCGLAAVIYALLIVLEVI